MNIFEEDIAEQKLAVAYYRHSAEDKQENSVPIQRQHTQRFATEHNIAIIHEEADEGKTGLLADRPGFNRLFRDWIRGDGAPVFDYVLVYDVSRWGRFQDQDEAAYYEFLCKRRGKQVVYISRGFPKEEQRLMAHLQTSIERYMAAEYSRQLSEKVFYGSAEVARQGYSAGGMACYGMQRLLLSVDGKPLRRLRKGEHKQIANERVTFAPAEDGSSAVVQDIFRLCAAGMSVTDIVQRLNEQAVAAPAGGAWVRDAVLRVLRNETYTGTRIYNRISNRLRRGRRRNPRHEWVICRDAFEALVDRRSFEEIQIALSQQPASRLTVTLLGRARRLLLQQISSFLERKGYSRDCTSAFVPLLPVTMSIGSHHKDEVMWCFSIPPTMRNYPDILAVGVSAQLISPVFERFFLISANVFGMSGVHTVFKDEQGSAAWTAERDDVLSALEKMMNGCQERHALRRVAVT